MSSKSSLSLSIDGSKCHFEWLNVHRCVVGGPSEGLERGSLIVPAPSGSRDRRDGAVGLPCEATFKQAALAAMLCLAAAGTHTSAGQSSWLFAGFLVSLMRKQLLKAGGLLASGGVIGISEQQMLESFSDK